MCSTKSEWPIEMLLASLGIFKEYLLVQSPMERYNTRLPIEIPSPSRDTFYRNMEISGALSTIFSIDASERVVVYGMFQFSLYTIWRKFASSASHRSAPFLVCLRFIPSLLCSLLLRLDLASLLDPQKVIDL